MMDEETIHRIRAQIDVWDELRMAKKRDYIAAGMPDDEADDRATHEVRMEIRRSDFWKTL
jgi:hypothetical protein